MTEPRRFSASQRAALFLAADGRCSDCGTPLEPGWHADHMKPWSVGGPRDVRNGQALCPTCNLKKGSAEVSELRDWQRQAIDMFFARNRTDFLVSATPGAGKTWFALSLAKRLLAENAVQRIAVVVPTDSLRQQWADAAAGFGLNLMPVATEVDYDKPGYHGCVATYAQLAGVGAALLRRSTRVPTIAILDEVHHAGDELPWGSGLTKAVEKADYRLALTGTPWRSDKSKPIPFVNYDPDGTVVVDYPYEYGAAVADGVCRGVVFDAFEGTGKWTDCGKVAEAELGADLPDADVPALLDAVYDPTNDWMPALLAEAVTALREIREEVPDAAGLVVAEGQWRAQRYAKLLTTITGTQPCVVVSDDPGAKDAIDRFKKSTEPWLIAVRMVSEGVDIPRLAVGVYASKIRTPLFFRQVIGRFVRTRPGEELTARLFIPAVPELMRHARQIEEELRHQLDLETELDEKARAEAASMQRTFDLRESLSATPAVFDRSIFGGEEITSEERARAEAECRRHGIPTTMAVQVAGLLRSHSQGQPVAAVTVAPTPAPEPRHRRERTLRTEVEKLARRCARREGIEVRDANTCLLRAGFPKRGKATVEQLESMREWLAARLVDG